MVCAGSGGIRPKKKLMPPSSGRTLYFSASAQNRSCSSLTFSGCCAAMLSAWLKSSGR